MSNLSRCPRCGTIAVSGAEFCQNPDCLALLGSFSSRVQVPIAPDARTGPITSRMPKDDPQYVSVPKRRSASTLRGGKFAPRMSPHGRVPGWLVRGVLALAAVGLVGGAAYLAGRRAVVPVAATASPSATQSPAVIAPHHRRDKPHHSRKPTAPKNETRTTVPTHTSTASSPVSSTPEITPRTTTTQNADGMGSTTSPTENPYPQGYTLTGQLQNNQIVIRVWVGLSPQGPLYPFQALVDTGAVHTMVSGRAWAAMGAAPTGQQSSFSGVGGSESVGYWPDVYVYPQDYPAHALLAGVTEPGGIGRTTLPAEGIAVLLGQDWLQGARLTESGTTWTLTYQPQP